MKQKNELYQVLETMMPKLYSFAHALVPDHQSCEKLIIDAFHVFSIKEADVLEGLNYRWQDKKIFLQFKKDFFKMMLKHIYRIGRKSFYQRYPTEEMLNGLPQFYAGLDVEARSILYLRHHLSLKYDDIAQVIEVEKFKVIQRLHFSRTQLLDFEKQNDPARGHIILGENQDVALLE
jgi:hypothetical protein